MASTSIDFYTTAAHRAATVLGAESLGETAQETLLDQNLNTYWEPADTGWQHVDIDTGGVDVSIDAIGIWICNYDTDFSSAAIYAYAEDTTGPDDLKGTTAIAHNSTGLFFFDLPAAYTDRYWRIGFSDLPSIPKIGQIFLLKKRTINTTPEFPLKENRLYFNGVSDLQGGYQYVEGEAGNYITEFDHTYHFIHTTNRDAYLNVYDDSKGMLRPFIYRPNGAAANGSESYICRFQQNSPKIVEEDWEYWKVDTEFRSLPFIRSGESM